MQAGSPGLLDSVFIVHHSSFQEGARVNDPTISRLRDEVLQPLKDRFVGRDEVVDLIALALVSGEHLFLLGPPGTAKSLVIRQFAQAVRGSYFEYMLTRFSEPNEIFGPIDIARLREGTVATVVTGMLPEAEFAFLDELFNANSAILNNLLTVLNERVYRRGAEIHRLPLLSLFSASNHLPEDDALRALFDRFLLRCQVDNLKPENLPRLLTAGWALEQGESPRSTLTADDLRELTRRLFTVDLRPVLDPYTQAVLRIRDLGIAFSDRRAVKVLKLLAGSALLCGRTRAVPADLWVLRYLWDRVEQIAPLRSLVQGLLEQHAKEEDAHPLARPAEQVDPEDLARRLQELDREAGKEGRSLLELARLKERVSDIADKAAWVRDELARKHLLEQTTRLLRRLG
jgi:MoxR-like ATPase